MGKGLCTGCETCLDRCQMGAISANTDGLAEIKLERCIGCGLCVITCPAEAMELKSKPDEVRLTPPETSLQQMALMAEKRSRTSAPLTWLAKKTEV